MDRDPRVSEQKSDLGKDQVRHDLYPSFESALGTAPKGFDCGCCVIPEGR